MELKARYEASLWIEAPRGISVQTDGESVDGTWKLRVRSTSAVSSEDAIAQISLMMRALEHALSAGGNDV